MRWTLAKILIPTLLILVLMTACGSPPVVTENPFPTKEHTKTITPIEDTTPISESTLLPEQIEQEVIVSSTATFPPSVTPVEPSKLETDRWHWVFSPELAEIQVVNQIGETKSIGKLDLNDDFNSMVIQINKQNALFFSLLNGVPDIKLFDLEKIYDVILPGSFTYDENMFLYSIQVLGVFENFAYFTFATEPSYETTNTSYPEKGPLYQIDLNTNIAKLIDDNLYQSSLSDDRHYFFFSNNQSTLRYFKEQDSNLLLNELDLKTGSIQTIVQSSGSPNGVYVSTTGDSFYLTKTNLYVLADGTSKTIIENQSKPRLLRSGEIVLLPLDCTDSCDIDLIDPLSNNILGKYKLPWSSQSYFQIGTQLLADGSLLWIGTPKIYLIDTPTNTEYSSQLDDYDYPVFRLNQDGTSQLIGVFRPTDFMFPGYYPISEGERYFLLKSISGSSYFIYDSLENIEILNLPIKEGWDFDFGTASFQPEGILIQFSISNQQKGYSQVFSLLHYTSQKISYWENPEETTFFCPEIYEDGTIACWNQRQDLNYDFVRFRPGEINSKPLVENVYFIESIY